MTHERTIIALASPPGKGAIALIRMSGPLVRPYIRSSCKRYSEILEKPRVQIYTEIHSSKERSDIIDHALASFFPGPNSFTGENIFELCIHGSPVIIKEILKSAHSLGIQPAEAGEFTKRAFLNGKLDLAQAEAVADIISAESKSQARVAREQLEGKLSRVIESVGEPIRDLLAEIEAYIDFPDEDIQPETAESWLLRVNQALEKIVKYIGSFEQGKILREGALVVLAGVPNAGKSSLMNFLLGEDRAIVTEVPGTTRDTIEERVELDGILIRLLDTAGLFVESTNSRIIDLPEKLGIERSWKSIRQADLVLFLFDINGDISSQETLLRDLSEQNSKIIVLATKIDIITDAVEKIPNSFDNDYPVIGISAHSGLGVDNMKSLISNFLLGDKVEAYDAAVICNERHFQLLIEAKLSMDAAKKCIKERSPSEYVAFEIRQCLNSLSEIIGVTSTEDILGRIFSKFCIGK